MSCVLFGVLVPCQTKRMTNTIHTCTHACIATHASVCKQSFTQSCIHTHIRIPACMCAAYMHTCTHIYMQTVMQTYPCHPTKPFSHAAYISHTLTSTRRNPRHAVSGDAYRGARRARTGGSQRNCLHGTSPGADRQLHTHFLSRLRTLGC